jgi:hypothetical protein
MARLLHPAPRRGQRGLLTRIVSSLLGAACAGACIVALATWCAASLALLIASPARAQPAPALADPTRPPGGAAGTPGSTTGNGQRNAASPVGTARAPAPSAITAPALPPLLQGLHLPRPGTPSALIDGQVLLVGDRVQDWTVQSIHADGVWLARTAARPASPAPQATATRTPPAPASVAAAGHPPHTLWLSLLPPLAAASAVPRP